ncbi:MAG: ABC transporter ATP-binding protein [Erysipelotrichaceae bacterium]
MIEVKNITKLFKDKAVFEKFNLNIGNGELVAITGKSGCGKTTLLNMIGLIDTVYNGEIEYNGTTLHSLSSRQKQIFIRNNINYLFQNYALVDDSTVYDNLKLAMYYDKIPLKEKNEIIKKSLKEVNLAGYEDKKVYTLSGGEQQRVALARAMIKKGNIILADEPTGNLDEENRNIVLSSLIDQNKLGKTVIIVTHDPYVASKCNRIINL